MSGTVVGGKLGAENGDPILVQCSTQLNTSSTSKNILLFTAISHKNTKEGSLFMTYSTLFKFSFSPPPFATLTLNCPKVSFLLTTAHPPIPSRPA